MLVVHLSLLAHTLVRTRTITSFRPPESLSPYPNIEYSGIQLTRTS
jgi:hypothetical protein